MKMSTSLLLILIGIGIVTGAFAGMLGIGGAIIMIPALVFFLGFNQQMAQGTSLAVMLPPIGIIAAYNYYKAGQVNITYAMILAVCFLIGSYFGSKWALNLPQATLKKIFGILLLLVAAKMLIGK
ncbi:MAG TPA: sulfite exporter TauE/SafE family protein [Bacteroidales bacterium]|nr:sulfite exporter TauE/SafE family protein [Bacteroidales bacterium]